jgi:SAM-dependent methyltransferase
LSGDDHAVHQSERGERAIRLAEGSGQNVPSVITSLLRCSECGERVELRGTDFMCTNHHNMDFKDGYLDGSHGPRDANEARTLKSFGYEWTVFHAIQPEDEEFWHRYFADIDLDELRDRVAIDVGCGKARYTRFTANHVKAMIALDGSDAVKSAVSNLQDVPNSLVVKAAIDSMPVAASSFGLVSCLGVLHHLADPRSGFDRVAELLEPGGVLLLYMYSRPAKRGPRSAALGVARLFRRCTVRMPHRLLRTVSVPIALFLHCCFVIPGHYGRRHGVNKLTWLPLSFYHGKPLRSLWLDTFDRLSAPIEHRYVWRELESWFTSAGLTVQSVREESGLFIVARRPL